MNREQSDGEHSVVGTEVGPVSDEIAETGVEFCLLRGADTEPNRIPKDISSAWKSSYLSWDSNTDSGPWVGPNRNGPDVSCRYNELRDPVGRSRGIAGEAGKRLVHIRNAEPDISGTRKAATGCRGEVGKRPVHIQNAQTNVSETGRIVTWYRDVADNRSVHGNAVHANLGAW